MKKQTNQRNKLHQMGYQEEFIDREGGQVLDQPALESGWVSISGGIKRHVDVALRNMWH